MGVFSKKPKKALQPSRKQQRKQKRKEKKVKKRDFFEKKQKPGQFVLHPDTIVEDNDEENSQEISQSRIKKDKPKVKKEKTTEELRKKDFRDQKKLEKQMMKQRNKQLLEANKEEDKIIRQLEKQLGLKKRKTKALPKTFMEEGLDYLLEVVDPERMKNAVTIEKELNDNDEFGEDFELITGKSPKKKNKNKLNKENKKTSDNEDSFSENEDDSEQDQHEGFEDNSEEDQNEGIEDDSDQDQNDDDSADSDQQSGSDESEIDNDDELISTKAKSKAKKRKHESIEIKPTKKGKIKDVPKDDISDDDFSDEHDDHSTGECELENDSEEEKEKTPKIKGAMKVNADGTWEDIYGRLRAPDGSVITGKEQTKYIPPAARQRLEKTEKTKDSDKVIRLRRQLKGLLNRLAESNMHNITNQMEELYMNNSRNDMNDTLTNLMLESLVTEVITPERLLIEHIMLISILHANVGTEVGAHFLQTIVRKFDEIFQVDRDVENKTLDNTVLVIAQLYNFKVFDAKLMYEVLAKLSESFDEKCIECILHILRNVGFTLRKDDPVALKNLILNLQKRAANVSDEDKGYSRVKFMLEILLAIKNNNVTKIPNYDVSYSEHLKKIMKGLIRKGNYITTLNISLEDLLKSDERGRWWVVGSAWSGTEQAHQTNENVENFSQKYSVKLLQLAKKQRMNTDARRNIFCIIMSAEDYLDAFEKLLKLGLKNQQEREIINVILHCCLQEKKYNPYYAHLAQKFCDYDRKYQMIIKYSVWDKLKTINEHSGSQISNLAKLLIHLFIEKGLPISVLKIVQFSELDKITLRFMRQVLIGMILHEDVESCLAAFAKVSISDKLKMFRESLRLFIHHFLLKNLKTETIPEDQKSLLEERAKMIENVLGTKDYRL